MCKHAEELQAKALEIFMSPDSKLEDIGKVYQMLEVSEKVKEICEENKSALDYIDYMKEENKSALDYYDMYKKTQDTDFLKMAEQELVHATKFYQLAVSSGMDQKLIDKELGNHNMIKTKVEQS